MRVACLLLGLILPAASLAGEVTAATPSDVSVTVYANPWRTGRIALSPNGLSGYALITEKRAIDLPAGQSTLRFDGVAGGIIPESAIVIGLPGTVVEKNRDARLLDPATLVKTALGAQVTLIRTDRKTGKIERRPATIVSGADRGILFRTEQGVEAFHCSGAAETLDFDRIPPGVGQSPTLSVKVRSDRATRAVATLSYLAEGFDWSADYVGTLSPDGTHLDLGGWITLANKNDIGFARAQLQVVAGDVNQTGSDVPPMPSGGGIVASCWPMQNTSDIPAWQVARWSADDPFGLLLGTTRRSMAAIAAMPAMPSPAIAVAEDLGDLKLYRVPFDVDVAARQLKQVRLIDHLNVAVGFVYRFDYPASETRAPQPATLTLVSRNDKAHGLGVPLPRGYLRIFEGRGDAELLTGQAPVAGYALDEVIELPIGPRPDVEVAIHDVADQMGTYRIAVSNAKAEPAPVEIRLSVAPSKRIAHASRDYVMKDGRAVFHLDVPANMTMEFDLKLVEL